MRTGLSAIVAPVVLALTACASQGTVTQPAIQPAIQPASQAAPAVSAATPVASKPAAKATQEADGTKVNARVGNFRRTTKNGQTLYCEKAEFVGSKMTKTRCLTEGEFKTLQERNAEMLEDLNRAQNSTQPVNDLPSQPNVPY